MGKDLQKAKYYYELAAMGGNVKARYNLGNLEKRAGDVDSAVKHWMISAAAGDDNSMKAIHDGYTYGHVTEDDIEKAWHAHKEARNEMKSEQRDAAEVSEI